MRGGEARAPFTPSGTAAGLLLTLVVAVPTLVLAEDWHGRPLIDHPGLGWLVPTVVAALAFVAGGAVAGRRHRRLGPALAGGLAVGVVSVLLLLAADGARRLLVNPTLPMGVVDYWIEAAAGSIVLALLGAGAGYRLLPTGRSRRSSTGAPAGKA